ncbi:MAG: hypothetical protein KGI45_01040 [Patescibacteria group bacterium]|nr:hypothetical protein [Patescibacteria group bacterium]MDE1940784.1 hypothetical protein [Patescibacteria group bacterium]MDE1966643.1 hypothetical protein [Patescibacteria group bacterium]
MSKHQAIRAIRVEIERLNQEIDLKIIRGASYRREALRHKTLMAQLARLSPRRKYFAGFGNFVRMFLF